MPGLRTYPSKTGLSLFIPFQKVDDEERMVWGYASTEAVDSEGEIVTKEALVGALPDYMKFANIREMHQLSAVGVAKEAEVDEKGLYLGAKVVDDNAWVKVKEGVYKGYSIGGRATARDPKQHWKIVGLDLIEISLVDRPANPEALFDVWRAEGSSQKKGRTMPKAHQPHQNWDCGLPGHQHTTRLDAVKCMQAQDERFGPNQAVAARDLARAIAVQASDMDAETLVKASVHLENFDPNAIKIDTEGPDTKSDVTKAEPDEKVIPDPVREAMKTVTPVTLPELEAGGTGDPRVDQGLRDAARYIAAANDPSLVQRTQAAIDAANDVLRGKKPKPKDDDGDDDDDDDKGGAEAEGADKAAEGDDLDKKKKDPDKPYGDVKYADPGYQEDGKARYPIDTEGHIRAAWNYINKENNAAKYTPEQVSSIKRRIVSAWKKEIDPDGPPSAKVSGTKERRMSSKYQAAFGAPDTKNSVKKGIETVIAMLSAMKALNDIRNCLDKEKAAEGDDSAATSRCDVILASLGDLVKDVCGEEIGELLESHMDVDFRWGRGPYDIAWAAKALRPAMMTMSKAQFAELWDAAIGDDTAKSNYLALSEFSDNISKAKGTLSIEEWTKPGDGTSYGPHSSDGNDSWGAHGEDIQRVHDFAVKMGATCETSKTHSDIPGATGDGDPKDPPKDIKDGTGGHSNIDGATGPGDPKDPPKELAGKKPKKPNEGKRDDEDKDPPEPASKSDRLLMTLLERTFENNDRLMDIVERGLVNGREGRDPPRPRSGGPFKTVSKGDDFEPAPGGDGKGSATGDNTKKGETQDPMDVLKAVLESPRFLSR